MPLFAFAVHIFGAAFADGFVACDCADIVGVVPAAFAFFAVAGFGGNGEFAAGFDFDFGHQEGKAQFFAQGVQVVGGGFRCGDFGFCLQ